MAVLSVTFCLFSTSELFKLISLGLHLLSFDWLYWSPSWRGNSWWHELQPILPRWCNLYGSCSVWRFSGVRRWSVSFAIFSRKYNWLYITGTPATTSQMAKDVVTFLSWAAEPEHDERKKYGIKAVILFSTLFTLSLYIKRFKWGVIKNRKISK